MEPSNSRELHGILHAHALDGVRDVVEPLLEVGKLVFRTAAVMHAALGVCDGDFDVRRESCCSTKAIGFGSA
jgi:hypothetical protein